MNQKKSNGPIEKDSIISFPCDFTLKIIGKTNSDFEKVTLTIVKSHFSRLSEKNIQKKFSKDNNFLSLSIAVHAESKSQLDALYQALSDSKEILMVL